MIPQLTIHNSELLAVPAVHNRAVFAEHVHRACREEITRPDAIAVELGQGAVAAVMEWLRELGVVGGKARPLPCMLGLVKTNHRIHPRHREAALRLQELHGAPLHLLPPGLLRRNLGFAPVGLVCLSGTDSIIEAIRCGVEFDIPVFGIDLEDVAVAERGQPLIQDPVLAQDDLAAFVEHNAPLCVEQRDAYVDLRREWVMAARLKALLRRHHRILFTCGIGHWEMLCRLLVDPQIQAATDPAGYAAGQFKRVLVAPSLAICQMDLFPELTIQYEEQRRQALNGSDHFIDYAQLCRGYVASALEHADSHEREALPAFSQYLSNLCLVSQCRFPDVFMMLGAARTMLSEDFADRLAEHLVIRSMNWAKPEDWPGLPYLRCAPVNEGAAGAGLQAEMVVGGRRSRPFPVTHARCTPRSDDWSHLPLIDEPPDGSEKEPPWPGYSWLWPPCEALLHATAYSAAEAADRKASETTSEPFSGSLRDGVDVKATLRAHIRGEQRIHVKTTVAAARASLAAESKDEPSVFLFSQREEATGATWQTLQAAVGSDIRLHVRNTGRFDQVTREHGEVFIACTSFQNHCEPEAHLKKHVSDMRYLHGIVLFGNPTLSPVQAARWLEKGDYRNCPILRFNGIHKLCEYYQRAFRLRLDIADWPTSLIRMALPYSKRRVLVMGRRPQAIPVGLAREANALGRQIEFVPLSEISDERIEAMRRMYFVRPSDPNTFDYPDEMQAAFGEPPTKHFDSLPRHIRNQLRYREYKA